ncbi:MAG: DNA topoisomerase IB [Caldimonas sp.]
MPRGIVYVSDRSPGIRRYRQGDAFFYRDAGGRKIRRASELKRIRALAVPPAYEDVWICTRPNGHLQATGRDARGRKQYRYHPEFRAAREADKFMHMLAFGAALPRVRARVKKLLATPLGAAPGREVVLATIVRLLDTTLIRVGNDEYARDNRSFGLTTLRCRHAAVRGSRLCLRFRGKSGIEHEVALDDPRIARIVRRCQEVPGQELFQFVDDAGVRHPVDSQHVNDFLRDATGADFTAKDFRTWHGTVHALDLWLAECSAAPSARRSAKELLADVARRLGNTVAVCRKSYVHPRVLAALGAGADESVLAGLVAARRAGLTVVERRLLAFLAAA